MASANGTIISLNNTKQFIVSSLSKRLKLDPKKFLGDMQTDIKSLCINILKSSENGTSLVNNDEVMKWISFAENFPIDSEASFKAIQELSADLGQKSVLMGGGLKPSEVDIIVFSALYPSVLGLSGPDKDKFLHLMRWIDYIQNVEDFGESFERISVEKAEFEPYLPKVVAKVEVDSNAKKVVKGTKDSSSNLDAGVNSDTSSNVVEVDSKAKRIVKGTKDGVNLESGLKSNKSADVKKAASDNKATSEKKKLPEKEADEKDKEISVSLLKIQVGQIRKAWKHPSADSLLVEEIDVGDKVRQVVSGLAKYCSPDELMNRRVVLVTNVKPGKLRDVMSEGLVLCASSEDHTIVEPLTPPKGAKVGESITFSGYEGKPEDVLNPKKKQLEKITPHLFTTDTGVATFKGIPFMTSGGPCTSSIPNGSIK